MVIESIKALKDPPRKGSTLGSIKETISLNWDVNMKMYDHRIKKYITNALATGEITQPKGKGFRGRFSVPGMKQRRKKNKKRVRDPGSDDEELNWKPEPTQRSEEKEKHERELEQRREERRMWAEEKMIEKMNRPKKSPKKVNKNKEWAVEAIKGVTESNLSI